MAQDLQAPEKCVKAVKALRKELTAGKKSLFNQDMATVNRTTLLAQLEYLEENLPDVVEKAADIVKDQENMLQNIKNEEARIIGEAQAQAKDLENNAREMVAEAENRARNGLEQAAYEAQQMKDQAGQEANATVEAARMEAQRIVEEAEKKAVMMTQQEEILRRAKDESEKLMDRTRQEMGQLRQNTLDYVDNQLALADRNLSDLINGIRMERNEVRNRR